MNELDDFGEDYQLQSGNMADKQPTYQEITSNELVTLRCKLMDAFMDGIISLNTMLFAIKTWKTQLFNEICKN